MVEKYRRFAMHRLEEAAKDTPVILIHGPRQCGKTTLAQLFGEAQSYEYVTFDDLVQLDGASSDPVGFVRNLPERVILDEFQRVPQIFLPLKAAVDSDRRPGGFILTGSTNVLLLPKLADSLAGRLEILRLHPLSQEELAGSESDFLAKLFSASFPGGRIPHSGLGITERIINGGYPAALSRESFHRKATWYHEYIETIVQRDVRDLARIASLDSLPRLLRLAASQTSRMVNLTDLASAFQFSRPTLKDYIQLLERVFLIEQLPPWSSNRISRLIKSSKLHITDTGLAAALLGADASTLRKDRVLLGQLLETFVLQELRRQASRGDGNVSFYHFRTKDGVEVDLVLESGSSEIAGVEIKASATVTKSDFRGLTKLRDAHGDHFACGVVLYDGDSIVSFGDSLFAVPLHALWEL
jgi:uncharacterized protein